LNNQQHAKQKRNDWFLFCWRHRITFRRKEMKIFCFLFPIILFKTFASVEKEVVSAFLAIDLHGKGNPDAVKALALLDELDQKSILPLLTAMNQANPIGDNWIRGAINQILKSSKFQPFPSSEIKGFIQNKENIGSSRRSAFELLQDFRPKLASSMVPKLINDPEPSLRREAVARLLNQASTALSDSESKKLYTRALTEARDAEQIKVASNALKEMGQEINLVELMGFLTEWELIGPFDNTERAGFGKTYEPETTNKESYPGKNGQVQWSPFSTSDSFGMLDINQKFGEIKEVLAYGKTDFYSDKDRKAQFRLGSKNAWKIWVNGKLLFARDEYHRGGTRVDQFILDGALRKGKNQIMVKVCQNEQTQHWTKQWEFCLRVTDPSGRAIKQARKK